MYSVGKYTVEKSVRLVAGKGSKALALLRARGPGTPKEIVGIIVKNPSFALN